MSVWSRLLLPQRCRESCMQVCPRPLRFQYGCPLDTLPGRQCGLVLLSRLAFTPLNFCRPAPGWDGDCCPDEPATAPEIVIAKCCDKDFPYCGCGNCSADPKVSEICLPPPSWDGDCCPDEPAPEPEIVPAKCCDKDFPYCGCGNCSADPKVFEYCLPPPDWDGDCCTDEPPPEPEVEPDKCCSKEYPSCACDRLCSTPEEAAQLEKSCPSGEGAGCCNPRPPAPCCSRKNPDCVCGQCTNIDFPVPIACPIGEEGASCCKDTPPIKPYH